MDALNISLPKAMKEYVQERVSTGGYGNTSEYVRDLIRGEQKQRAKEELEALIIEGINSGPSTPMTKADWQRLHDRLNKKAQKRPAAQSARK